MPLISSAFSKASSSCKVMNASTSTDICYAIPKEFVSEEDYLAFGTRLDSIDFSTATNL